MVNIKSSLKSHIEDQVRYVQQNPSEAVREPRVDTRLVENLMTVSEFEQHGKKHTFTADEAKWNGGDERGPTPLRYFLSGLGFCQQVWYAKCAALLGITVDSVEISVGTRLDVRGELGVPGFDPALERINLETKIASNASEDKILELRKMVNNRCPIINALRKGMPIKEKLIRNGTMIYEGPG